MPLTPYHFGIGAAFKAIGPSRFSLVAFGPVIAQCCPVNCLPNRSTAAGASKPTVQRIGMGIQND